MNKGVIAGIAVVVVIGGFVGYKYMSMRAEAAKWSGPMKEIVDESVQHDGTVTKIRFVSLINGPIAKVQQAVWDVENSQQMVPNIKESKLLRQEGNTKVLEMGIQALNLPTLTYEMEFTLHPESHTITFKTTKSQAQDIEGEYKFEASPDGQKTRMTYTTTSKDKIAVPFPQSVLDGANRETYVNTVRGIEKAVKQG